MDKKIVYPGPLGWRLGYMNSLRVSVSGHLCERSCVYAILQVKERGEGKLLIGSERQKKSFTIFFLSHITPVCSRNSTAAAAPVRPLTSPCVSVYKYKQCSFVQICTTKSCNFCQKFGFASASSVRYRWCVRYGKINCFSVSRQQRSIASS